MDKQYIIGEIKRTAEENGGEVLGKERFQAETGIRESHWLGRYWTKWGDAVREAGYSPNKMQGAYDSDWLLERLASLIRVLGHYPTSAELRMQARIDDNFPSHNTFARFGHKAQAISTLIGWCESHPGWEDVQSICTPLLASEEIDDEAIGMQPSTTDGYVYLFKSGRYYKLGRSNSPGRREYELSIQLPEPVVKIHTIATDDPVGIEQYWHNRFKDRRKNGEWFELRKVDVDAFKRRKFM